jgi:hypothetical protein
MSDELRRLDLVQDVAGGAPSPGTVLSRENVPAGVGPNHRGYRACKILATSVVRIGDRLNLLCKLIHRDSLVLMMQPPRRKDLDDMQPLGVLCLEHLDSIDRVLTS